MARCAAMTKSASKKYFVEKILAHRIAGKRLEVLVRWLDSAETTWQSELEIRKPAALALDKYFNRISGTELKRIRTRTGRIIRFNEQAYEVEAVTNIQRDAKTGELKAYVLWRGFPTRQTWESQQEVARWCREAHEAYVENLSDEDKEMLKTGMGELSPQPEQLEAGCYEVEAIVGLQNFDGRKMALVKWLGWPESFNSWEPLESVQETAKEALELCYSAVTEHQKKAFEEGLPSHVASLFRDHKEAAAPVTSLSYRSNERAAFREFSPEL